MKVIVRAVYNYFRMLRKDSGAHFTYNLGVGLVRVSLLFFLWGALIFAEWYVLGNPAFTLESNAQITVIKVAPVEPADRGHIKGLRASFLAERLDNGEKIEMTQFVSYEMGEYYAVHLNENIGEFNLFSLTGTGKNSGKDMGWYIAQKPKFSAEWEYYFSTPGAHAPVQTWAIWVSFAVSLVLFLMGRRQIRLSMKYPRSDVPVELSGAPDIMYNDEYFRERAGEAVRADMQRNAESTPLLTGYTDNKTKGVEGK